MNFPKFVFSVLPLFFIPACGGHSPPKEAMGLKRIEYTDNDRADWTGNARRPLTTHIWYPAKRGSSQAEIGIPPDNPVFIAGYAARNASPDPETGKQPLIILSHGTGGAAMQLMWLARPLVEAGYIVAAVDHHGNTAAEDNYDARGFKIAWERPVDLSRVIDKLLESPDFGPIIDRDHIAAVGFSLGGYSAISLAGGRIDLGQFARLCAGPDHDKTCDPQDEYPDIEKDFAGLREKDPRLPGMLARHADDFGDRRIKYVAALAPALGLAFTDDSLRRISIPVRIIVGDEDKTAPATTNGARIASRIRGAQLTLVKGASHYIFLNRCTWKSRLYIPVCKDPHADREQVHKMAAQIIFEDLKHSGF